MYTYNLEYIYVLLLNNSCMNLYLVGEDSHVSQVTHNYYYYYYYFVCVCVCVNY